MSLYQKVRPTELDQIIGNESTIGALRKLIRRPADSRPHTILLKGPRGCGKTTLARILAKEFGSIGQGVIELNAANTRGIETIRERVSNCIDLTCIDSPVKTYIFDESHQFTVAAQEALLKDIEDNPPHCYFIFCTTEPQNLIDTIRSRCTPYEVSPLDRGKISKILEDTVKKLSLKVDDRILEAISHTCEGFPRTALVQLEQIQDIEDEDQALDLLVRGTEKDSNIIDLCKLLMLSPKKREEKWKRIIEVYDSIEETNVEMLRRSILTFLFNKLKKTDDIEIAKDLSHLLTIFSYSVYYGGKSQLGALIARACFGT